EVAAARNRRYEVDLAEKARFGDRLEDAQAERRAANAAAGQPEPDGIRWQRARRSLFELVIRDRRSSFGKELRLGCLQCRRLRGPSALRHAVFLPHAGERTLRTRLSHTVSE